MYCETQRLDAVRMVIRLHCACMYGNVHVSLAVAQDGRLEAGDMLLEVDGRSLVGLSQEQ